METLPEVYLDLLWECGVSVEAERSLLLHSVDGPVEGVDVAVRRADLVGEQDEEN